MQKGKLIGFNPNALKKQMLDNLVEVQTQRLIGYAEDKIREIGNRIQTYNSKNHMDRTGNLLNSLCWGVAYNNKLKGSGFFREAQNKSYKRGRDSESNSYLHEYFQDYKEAYLVEGRYLAERFMKSSAGRASGTGYWRVWFAILAPYWGYWEEGFTQVHYNKNSDYMGATFRRFAVMTEFHDKVKNDLRPAKVELDVYVPEYSHETMEYDFERYQNNVDHPYKYAK